MPDEVKCNFCSCELCSCLPPIDDRGEPDHDVIIVFWTLNMAFIIFNIVFELMMLMYLAVRYCVQVAWALDYRLVPLNADRAFVADSLVRAAFELGNPDSPVLGVDPHRETTSSNRMRIALMVILYKAKVVGTGLILKALLNLTAPAWFSIFAKPVSNLSCRNDSNTYDCRCIMTVMHGSHDTHWATLTDSLMWPMLCAVGWRGRRDCVLGLADRPLHCAPSGDSWDRRLHVGGAVQRSVGSAFRQRQGYQPAREDPDRARDRRCDCEAGEHVRSPQL